MRGLQEIKKDFDRLQAREQAAKREVLEQLKSVHEENVEVDEDYQYSYKAMMKSIAKIDAELAKLDKELK